MSSEEQVQGYSRDAQARACRELAAARGWTVAEEYRDEGRSAHTDVIARRPEFRRLLDDVRDGRLDVVVVHKVDRFAHNVRINFEALDVLGRAGVAFVSVAENVDYTTPQGRVFLGMLALFAQFYSDNLGQEVKKGKAERKAQGLYNGPLPFGYTKGPDRLPVLDPDTHPGVILAFEAYAQGLSDRDVTQLLNDRGYRTAGNMGPEDSQQGQRRGGNLFTKDTVRGIVQNRFYLGELPDGQGGWTEGEHPAAIGKDLFDAVQEAREGRRRAPSPVRRNARTYSLSALMRCRSCGGRMQVTENRGGRVRYYCRSKAQGLACTAKGTYLHVYESQILGHLRKVRLPEDYQARVLELFQTLRPEAGNEARERQELEARLERTKRLFQWGDIDDAEYRATRDEITRRLRALTPETEQRDRLAKLREYLESLPRAWEDATQEQRNRLLRVLLDAVWVENEKVVALRPRPEFQPLFAVSCDTPSHSAGSGDPDGDRSRMIQQWDFPVDEPVLLSEWRQKRLEGDIATFARRLEVGETLRAVAAEYGVSHETLRRLLKRAGMQTTTITSVIAPRRTERRHHVPGRGRSSALTPTEAAEVVGRHLAGESARSLRRRFGVSHETIRRIVAGQNSPLETEASA